MDGRLKKKVLVGYSNKLLQSKSLMNTSCSAALTNLDFLLMSYGHCKPQRDAELNQIYLVYLDVIVVV
jgi:tRNA U34 5-methylaminomethyl-2-thiouridine-forming methyltransferase MnmC